MPDVKDRLPPKTTRWLVVVLVVGGGFALAAAFAFRNRQETHSSPAIAPVSIVSPATTTEAAPQQLATVHVSGAVVNPGLVSVPDGSRVADAIAATGGARSGGHLGNLNLAAPVTDGMHLVVPWTDDGIPAPISPSGTGSSGLPVDLNRAGPDELTELPGVGEVLAARIVIHREAHGPFDTLEDLLDVPGIGEGKLEGLRDYASVRR